MSRISNAFSDARFVVSNALTRAKVNLKNLEFSLAQKVGAFATSILAGFGVAKGICCSRASRKVVVLSPVLPVVADKTVVTKVVDKTVVSNKTDLPVVVKKGSVPVSLKDINMATDEYFVTYNSEKFGYQELPLPPNSKITASYDRGLEYVLTPSHDRAAVLDKQYTTITEDVLVNKQTTTVTDDVVLNEQITTLKEDVVVDKNFTTFTDEVVDLIEEEKGVAVSFKEKLENKVKDGLDAFAIGVRKHPFITTATVAGTVLGTAGLGAVGAVRGIRNLLAARNSLSNQNGLYANSVGPALVSNDKLMGIVAPFNDAAQDGFFESSMGPALKANDNWIRSKA